LNGGALRRGRGRRQARPGAAPFRSPLTALAVVLSLIIQLVAIPYHQALSSPAFASQGAAAISAELKAAFGDAAALCFQVGAKQADGKSAPAAPAGCCDDQCPFCRFAVQSASLIAPDAPALPERVNADSHAIRAGPDFLALFGCPAQSNRARAPPPSLSDETSAAPS